MKVLIACEESQTVCKEFRKRGHEAYSCDIQDCRANIFHPELNDWHIKGDAIKEAYSGKYDLMIAHPPCTKLSNAAARWLYAGGNLNVERYNEGIMAKEFFMKLLQAPIKMICIENPTPSRIYELPKYSQVIQPYEFGHEYSKRTLLWLKNLPLLAPTDIKSKHKPFMPSNTGGKNRNQKATFIYRRKKERSETFQGIAQAMAEQWGDLSNKKYLLETKIFRQQA